MSYSDYGLDDVKRSKDTGTKPKEWWCQWCNKNVTNGLYLCFSNWCICPDCLELSFVKHVNELVNKTPVRHKWWIDNVECFKCGANGITGYENHHSCSTKFYLCKPCTDLGNQLVNKLETNSMKKEIQEVMGELKMVKLASITPSLTNPRKTFDEDAINELAASINEKGVISPVLLRPLGKDSYELVCGERRYRASLMVQKDKKSADSIPAYIRDMSDDEALELQITENLQRKDVHPMEEAAGFQALINSGYPVEEIKERLGKSLYFVNQRIKLNSLSEDWQKLFFYDKISLTDALKVAQLSTVCQEHYLENMYGKEFDAKEAPERKVNNWDINKYRGQLSEAKFSLDDKMLDPSVGSCIGCQYNSATANLFSNSNESPTCSNLVCFNNKSDIFFNAILKDYLEQPGGVLIIDNYGDTKELNKTFADTGLVVLNMDGYERPYEPEKKMDFQEWKDDNYFDEETDEEIQQEYNQYCQENDEEWKEYNEDIQSGSYVNALVVDGRDKGAIVQVKVNKKKQAGAALEAVATSETAGLVEEITRIEDREARSKELDAEKVHSKVKEALKTTAYWKTIGPLKDNELIAGILMYKNTVSYSDRDWAKKLLGTHYDEYGGTKLIAHLQKQSSEQLHSIFNQLLRYKVFVELTSDKDNPVKNSKAAAIRAIAMEYIPEDVKTFDLEQQEVAIKRQDRVNKKLSDLNEKKKEIEAAAKENQKKKPAGKGVKALLPDAPDKAAAKKSSPKKSAKK